MTISEIRLSPRQAQVVVLTAKGLTKRQVCEALGIRKGTLEAIFHQIVSKLGTSTKTELTMLALAKGWVDNPYLDSAEMIVADAPPDV